MDDFYTETTTHEFPLGFPIRFLSVNPLAFPAVQDWGRDIDSADEELVNSLIAAVTELFQSMTNRIFITSEFTGKFANLCYSSYEPYPFIEIRRSPLVSISELRVNGVANTDYVIKESSGFARVLFTTTPILDVEAYPIEVDFVAGYGTQDQIPGDVKTALQQWVLFFYENRGDVSPDAKQTMPFVVRHILKKYRIVNTYG